MKFPPLLLGELRAKGFKRQWLSKNSGSTTVQYELFLADRKLEVRLELNQDDELSCSVTHARMTNGDRHRLAWSTVATEFNDPASMEAAIQYESTRDQLIRVARA